MAVPSDSVVIGVQRRLAATAGDGLAWDEFGRAAIAAIARAVPFDAICLATVDPTTGLFAGTVKSGIDDSADDRFIHFEYSVADVNLFSDLADSPATAGILAVATGGDPFRSTRYRELLKPHYGIEHELRGVARLGERLWGTYALYRESSRPGFAPGEASATARFGGALALGMRQAIATGVRADSSSDDDEPVVVVIEGTGHVTGATPAAAARIVELGGEPWRQLPTAVTAAVEASRAVLPNGDRAAIVRTQSRNGGWVTVSAAPLDADGSSVAVMITRAGAADTLSLALDVYGVTPREAEVARLVAVGASTVEIAASMFISPYTVQDHLKSVFTKFGVSSRRELVAVLSPQRVDA